jgi:phage baseplate assembly protein W
VNLDPYTQGRDILGEGWSFPIKPDPLGRLTYLRADTKIEQSLWIILSTSPGERQMLPEFGCGIYDLVFEPNTAALRGLVREKVREALIRWEPRIDVLEVRVEKPEDQSNQLLIRVDYRVRSSNSLYNLVYPFYVKEGAQ